MSLQKIVANILLLSVAAIGCEEEPKGSLRFEHLTLSKAEYVLGEPVHLSVGVSYGGGGHINAAIGVDCNLRIYVQPEDGEEVRIFYRRWWNDGCERTEFSAEKLLSVQDIPLLVNTIRTPARDPGELIFGRPGRYLIRAELSVDSSTILVFKAQSVAIVEPVDPAAVALWDLMRNDVSVATFVLQGEVWDWSRRKEIRERVERAVAMTGSTPSSPHMADLKARLNKLRDEERESADGTSGRTGVYQ